MISASTCSIPSRARVDMLTYLRKEMHDGVSAFSHCSGYNSITNNIIATQNYTHLKNQNNIDVIVIEKTK
jgi:hypothetical protein